MSCQICVEVCPFEAIKMDTEFELSTDDRFGGLLLGQGAAGEVERALSRRFIRPKPPKSDATLAEEKAKAEAKAKAAAADESSCRATPAHPSRLRSSSTQ